MLEMLKYLGIVNSIFAFMYHFICVKANKDFDFKKHPFCYCGNSSKTKKFYNPCLAISGILQVIFYIILVLALEIPNPHLEISLFVIAGVALVVASIFQYGNHKKIHTIASRVIFVSAIIGALIFHIKLLFLSQLIGIVGVIFLAVLFAGSFILGKKYKLMSGVSETFLLSMIIIWNLIFSYVLLA
ncbi:MAG: DUF998 domain-containing protein [archaeon]